MAYIKVKVESAKLVLEEKGPMATTDYILKLQKKKKSFQLIGEKRDNFVDIEEPIQIGCVSNMLHVLFGARPVPSYREVLYKSNQDIFNIAKNGFVRIDSLYYYEDKNGVKRPISEFTAGKKNAFNSHSKAVYTNYVGGTVKGDVTWDTLKRRFLNENYFKYVQITSFLSEKLNIVTDVTKEITFLDALIKVCDNGYKNELICLLTELGGLNILIKFINQKTDDLLEFNSYSCKMASRLNNVHMSHKVTLNCEFIFEVTREQYNILMSGNQCATFLDGGYAYIVPQLYSETDIDFEDYNKILKAE